jgi:hypothetical protein
MSTSLVVAAKLGRNRGSMTTRRYKLRHPEPKPTHRRDWTARESNVLRARYPTAANTVDLLPLFPGFTLSQIRSRARYMGLKRNSYGDCDVPIDGHKELFDQIRIRAKQDGVPLSKIDIVLKMRFVFHAQLEETTTGKSKGGCQSIGFRRAASKTVCPTCL